MAKKDVERCINLYSSLSVLCSKSKITFSHFIKQFIAHHTIANPVSMHWGVCTSHQTDLKLILFFIIKKKQLFNNNEELQILNKVLDEFGVCLLCVLKF